MKKPYLLCFLILFGAVLYAQKGITLSASVNRNSILIGEPLELTLQATFSKAHVPVFIMPDSLPQFEILSRSKIDSQTTAGQTVLKQTVTLTSWDSGIWAIPAIYLTGKKGAATKPLVINVTHTQVAPGKDYNDVKDILNVQKPQRHTWYWYVVGAVLLLLLLLLVFPKTRKKPAETTAVIRESAYKKAMDRLNNLQAIKEPDDKAYFTELIVIFRTYLQHGKDIHSFHQTTDDLGRQLQQLELPHEHLKKLVYTLQLSDFVKFARYSTSGTERQAAFEEIKQSIILIEQIKK